MVLIYQHLVLVWYRANYYVIGSFKKEFNQSIDIYFIPLDTLSRDELFYVMNKLSGYNISCEIGFADNLKNQLKKANRLNAKRVVIIGEEERENRTAQYKNMLTRHQDVVPINKLG